jgi:hypothetical protein
VFFLVQAKVNETTIVANANRVSFPMFTPGNELYDRDGFR